MGCENVCIAGCDGDDAEIYHEQYRKARVAHKCFECHRTIGVGEQYEIVTGRWDGEWDAFRFCAECGEIGRAFTCGGGRTFGSLWEDIADQVFPELTSACLSKLTTATAKATLLDAWNDWKFG